MGRKNLRIQPKDFELNVLQSFTVQRGFPGLVFDTNIQVIFFSKVVSYGTCFERTLISNLRTLMKNSAVNEMLAILCDWKECQGGCQ